MDHKKFRILGLAGSLRRASFHRGILRAAHGAAPEWMSCESFDLGTIPYFNQDIEDQGYPEPVEELREKIRTRDAVLIATPEHDYAVPEVLTAALDRCLRSHHDHTPFRHKPVGIVGRGPPAYLGASRYGRPPGWCPSLKRRHRKTPALQGRLEGRQMPEVGEGERRNEPGGLAGDA